MERGEAHWLGREVEESRQRKERYWSTSETSMKLSERTHQSIRWKLPLEWKYDVTSCGVVSEDQSKSTVVGAGVAVSLCRTGP